MQILFLTLMKIYSPSDEGIYMDLMKCFAEKGHKVSIISPLEKKEAGEYPFKDYEMDIIARELGKSVEDIFFS